MEAIFCNFVIVVFVLKISDLWVHFFIKPTYCCVVFSSCSELYDAHLELVETLLSQPYQILDAMELAVITAQHRVMDDFTASQQQYMVGRMAC